MRWIPLIDQLGIEAIKEESFAKPQVIFKHSTTCSISSMALNRLERAELPEGMDFHYLDLLGYREVSKQVAEIFGVVHESPQVLIIKNGKCVYDESHYAINMDDIESYS